MFEIHMIGNLSKTSSDSYEFVIIKKFKLIYIMLLRLG